MLTTIDVVLPDCSGKIALSLFSPGEEKKEAIPYSSSCAEYQHGCKVVVGRRVQPNVKDITGSVINEVKVVLNSYRLLLYVAKESRDNPVVKVLDF